MNFGDAVLIKSIKLEVSKQQHENSIEFIAMVQQPTKKIGQISHLYENLTGFTLAIFFFLLHS